MSYNPLIEPSTTTGEHSQTFQQIQGAFGTVPNMFKAIGQSSAALESMWTSFVALGKGQINSQLGEQVAVFIANVNRCEYCLAAHTLLGQNAGLSSDQIKAAQAGRSDDARTQAALDFAAKIVKQRAQLSEQDVAQVKQAGFSDAEVAELVAHVALNIFTNYTNVALAVPVDFPHVQLIQAA